MPGFGDDLVFRSSALEAGDLILRGLEGHEGISRLFEFDIIVETTFGGALEPEQLEEVLAGTAYFAFGSSEEHKYHGVVREIEMLSMAEPEPVLYRLEFVPKLFDTTLTFGSRIYQDLSVPDILKDVLKNAGYVENDDFEFRGAGNYPSKEYVVQYAESSFDFISRLMEHEGIFYFFEHGDDRAKMVIVDSNNSLTPLTDHETIQYDPRGAMTRAQEVITEFTHARTMVPYQVNLQDYNYRTPSVSLFSTAQIDENGIGTQLHYGEHYKNLDAGRKLARIRAQELFAQQQTYSGASKVRGLCSGHKFTLEQHMISALDDEYIVTEMSRSVVPGKGTGYDEFVAVRASVPFRPRQVTPKPQVSGVLWGKIDRSSDGTRSAPVDELGRYKVLMPFSEGGEAGGRASRWVQLCRTTGLDGSGTLSPGTDVLLVHINGDPDRPVIVGAVPNRAVDAQGLEPIDPQPKIATPHGITLRIDYGPQP